VVPDRSRNNHDVSRLGLVTADLKSRVQHPHTGSGDIEPIRFAVRDHLGIAADYHHPSLFGCQLHGMDQLFQQGKLQAFLEDEAGGQVEGLGADHGQVVHGAANREPADISAREFQG
jgi:hypothetical protein